MDKNILIRLQQLEQILTCHDKDIKKIQKTCCPGGTDTMIVNAGLDQSVIINPSGTSVTLSGLATDAQNQIVVTSWSLVTGPSAVSIQNPGSLITTVSGLTTSGVYTFELSATNSLGITVKDRVAITANVSTAITYVWGWFTADPFSSLVVSDTLTYQGTRSGVIGNPLVADFRTAPANNYYVIRVPDTDTTKTSWFNTSLNNGSIPDNVFRPVLTTRGFKYYITRVAVTFDVNNQTTLT